MRRALLLLAGLLAWPSPLWATARDFNGTTDVITFASTAQNKFSFSAWFTIDGNGDSSFPRLIENPGYAIYLPRGAQTECTNCLVFASQRDTTCGRWTTANSSIVNGGTYHVVVSYDSTSTSNDPDIWLNGVLISETEQRTPAGTQITNTGTGYLGNNEALTRSFDGKLAFVEVFDRTLTADNAAALYQAPGGSGQLQAAFFWMNGASTSERDYSGNGRTATASGTTSVATTLATLPTPECR